MTLHDELFVACSQTVLENQHGETVVLAIEGREPASVTAIVSQEKRSRRYEATEVRSVRERTATVTAGLSVNDFDSLIQAKLSTTITVAGMKYAVEDVSMNGSSVMFTLVRDGRKEFSRPGYRGRGR